MTADEEKKQGRSCCLNSSPTWIHNRAWNILHTGSLLASLWWIYNLDFYIFAQNTYCFVRDIWSRAEKSRNVSWHLLSQAVVKLWAKCAVLCWWKTSNMGNKEVWISFEIRNTSISHWMSELSSGLNVAWIHCSSTSICNTRDTNLFFVVSFVSLNKGCRYLR